MAAIIISMEGPTFLNIIMAIEGHSYLLVIMAREMPT
jgi:hypothetical protein